jgi:hypothetical protein
MTHVYPFATDAERIWLGEHMMDAGAVVDEHPGHAHRHHH